MKPEILEALAEHGLRPRRDTPVAMLREQINDLYRIEIRKLRVVELRKRYVLLSIPVDRWLMTL